MTRGYLLISFGKAYIHEAVNLSKLLNKFGNKYPISIICSKDDFDYVKSFCIFDDIISFDFDNELSKNDETGFEKYGGTPKILIPDYLIYDETIFLDTDMLVQTNPENVWKYMKEINQCCVATGGPQYEGNQMVDILSEKLNIEKNKIFALHSGILFYDKTHPDFDKFSENLKFFWKNYNEYGLMIDAFRGGKADEHALIAASASLGYVPINPLESSIITHNYHSDIELPSKIVTGGIRYNVQAILEYPPPFIHMFRANGENHYEILYERLINL
jgi:hypothetical protein